MRAGPLRPRRLSGARRRGARSLGAQLVLVLTGVGLAGAVAITLLLAAVITPSFNQLEERSVDAHVERTRAVLTDYARKVESGVRDYGDWNDSYAYMAHPTAAFERESFSPLAMANLDVSGMAYVAPGGRVLIARWIEAGRREDPAMRAALVAAIGRMNLGRLTARRDSASFYLRLGSDTAAVGVAQVRRSDGTGTPRGWVLMARRTTSAQLSGLLQLHAQIAPAAADGRPVIERERATMRIAVPIAGPDGRPVASAAFTVPRDVSVLGRRMLLLAVAGSTVLLLLVLAALRRMITRLVLRPLHRVESHMQAVSASGALGLLAEDGRADEIGSLTHSFNSMLSQLRDLREQIEAQSFSLGRSESAVAVMHNVRNALTPVSTILSQGVQRPPPVDRATVERALAELARDDAPPPRRQKLAAYVAAALEAEGAMRAEQVRELQVGREAMANVLDIIGQQQALTHERPPLETCDVTEIVARNATIARYSGRGSIAFSFPAHAQPVLANRVLLSQVIGNLFSNAAEAIMAAGQGSGTICVTVRVGEAVEVQIRDDGEGFDPEVGATLFQRGFSTRAHKSGGLGLHWCANSVAAMNGSLRLTSEGRGKGAVAVLMLQPAPGMALAA